MNKMINTVDLDKSDNIYLPDLQPERSSDDGNEEVEVEDNKIEANYNSKNDKVLALYLSDVHAPIETRKPYLIYADN
jgi:hypothetical protein